MGIRQIAPTAVGLHHLMYTAFAEGDIKALRKICTDGILETFEGRIRARGKEKWTWELVKYNKSPRVMSHRGGTLGIDGAALRQAVVRIASRQKLTRYRDGKIVPGSGQEKDVLEYVVIQKMMLRGKEEDWRVWGTTDETTIDKLDEQRAESDIENSQK
jgi:protein MBA1